jgi:hypothetical protein
MFTNIRDHTKEFDQGRVRLSWAFGLVAGFFFILFAWGIPAVQLSMVHGMYPWTKLILGVLPVMILCCLSAFISSHSRNALISALVWMICGFAITFLATHISFEGLVWYYGIIDPGLLSVINYPFTSGIATRMVIALIVSVVAIGIAGSLFNLLLENAYSASAKAGTLVSLIIWGAFFAVSAQNFNSLLERPMRDPIRAINQTIDYRIIDEATPFDDDTARSLHIHAFNGVDNLTEMLSKPRKIVMQSYDDTLTMIKVAIDFSGDWVTCNVIADNSTEPPTQQLVFCRNLVISK